MRNIKIFLKRPSALTYMAGAFFPSPLRGRPPSIPQLQFSWHSARASAEDLAIFQELTGLPVEPLPILFPHAFGFRLSMALLTDASLPLPIWKALQVRNRLQQFQLLQPGDTFEIETRVAAARVLAKGMEIDLQTSFSTGGRLAWQSTVTFYYRGAFGPPVAAAADTNPPVMDGRHIAQWHAAKGQGWQFGRLTGDFNGLHWSDAYARAFGFRRAFHHPQRAIGQALAHLGLDTAIAGQQLEIWLRGQIYEDALVELRAALGDPVRFALFSQEDPRPAVIGRWSRSAP